MANTCPGFPRLHVSKGLGFCLRASLHGQPSLNFEACKSASRSDTLDYQRFRSLDNPQSIEAGARWALNDVDGLDKGGWGIRWLG